MKIYPSLISSDLLNLEKTINLLNPHCAGYHLDIMDGHFVPNITWGPAFINAIRSKTNLPLHVHLMVTNPLDWLVRFNLQPQDTVFIHFESFASPQECIQSLAHIRKHNYKVGLAINPSTQIRSLSSLALTSIDTILLMSVKPGFSGQEFMLDATFRLQDLIDLRTQTKSHFTIGLDGGINREILNLIAPQKVDFIAAAKAIFAAPDSVQALQQLSDITLTKDIS